MSAGTDGLELVVFVGLQASGKSTFYRERFAATHVLVSKDLLRNNRRPERRQRHLIAEALAAGRSVVVDNTNPTLEDRAALIALGRAAGARVVAYVFETPLDVCLARNAARTGRDRVPPVALFTTRKRMQPVTGAEGFDTITDVTVGADGATRVTPRPPLR
jgi:predicted kinase